MAVFQRYLLVCTGNTCRSPMAAALLRREAEKRGLTIEAESAGVFTDGSPAAAYAVEAMAEWGLDLSAHRSQNITPIQCNRADVIGVMSPRHKQLLALHGAPAGKIVVLGGGIPDPYGGSLDDYRFVRDRLAEAVGDLLPPLWVVPMKEQHLDALADIEKACFSHPWSREGLAAELHNQTAVFLVAERDGVPVGYLGMHQVLEDGDIARVAVHPKEQGKGVGFWLLSAAKRYAQTHGGQRLLLEVRLSNTPARTLYERFGFTQDGVRPRFYEAPTEDAALYSYAIPKDNANKGDVLD